MRRGWDANSKWICILCAALLFACGGLWALGRVLPAAPEEETQADWTLLTLNEARMTLYAACRGCCSTPLTRRKR